MKIAGSNYAECRIRKNRSTVLGVFTNPDSNSESGYYGSTNSVVLHLVHGDKVDVGSCSPIANIYHGVYAETTLSGFLLRAD